MKTIRDIALWIAITVWINFYPDRYRYDTVPQGRHGYWHIDHPWYPYARFLLPLLLAVWIAYKYSGLNLNQDKATKPQTVQIVRQGEATPYWFKFNPLYFKKRK